MNSNKKIEKEEEKEVDKIDFFVADMGSSDSKGLAGNVDKGKCIKNLLDALQSVNPKSSDAEDNKTSISDNNGGRIDLDEDLTKPEVIKK